MFSLARWSSRIPTGFHVPRGTWVPTSGSLTRFRLRGYHPLWRNFPDPSTNEQVFDFPTPMREGPGRSHDTDDATLARLAHHRFGLFPFRSPLLRESRLLSFPGGTEMVHFPPFAPSLLLNSEGGDRTLLLPGFPIRASSVKHAAANRGFSQLTTPFIASQRQGIHRTPLLA